jgi:hypothetical protein
MGDVRLGTRTEGQLEGLSTHRSGYAGDADSAGARVYLRLDRPSMAGFLDFDPIQDDSSTLLVRDTPG